MTREHKHLFRIEEVTSAQSQYLIGMNRWMEMVFPEYCPPRFDRLLAKLRKADDRPQIQIFIGLFDDQVVGLVQVFYRVWQGGLLADIDLLGVLETFRRTGLGLALFRQALRAANEVARWYQVPVIGLASLIDPQYEPIVQLHQKLSGQIRRDYAYPSGDLIVWYPMMLEYENVSTRNLGEQLQQFAALLE
jgi:GNAT superfamily N-acetyltransferase